MQLLKQRSHKHDIANDMALQDEDTYRVRENQARDYEKARIARRNRQRQENEHEPIVHLNQLRELKDGITSRFGDTSVKGLATPRE